MQPEIAVQLAACGVPVFPCWDNKNPAVKNGFKDASTVLGEYWPSCLVGVPIPDGVVVIDVDTYKGMTTDLIEKVLGSHLNWSAALLQHTPSGGSHYAFRVTDTIRQSSDLFYKKIGKGFDTRTAGRGYICSGGEYVSSGAVGILKIATPDALPPLPPEAVAALSTPSDDQHEPTPLPAGDRSADEVLKMLHCLPADCTRAEWMNTALALKHHYHDDDATGWILFNNWSMSAKGKNSKGGPMYDKGATDKMWSTTKPVPDDPGIRPITLGTLSMRAIENGYIPSSIAADIFGADAADPQFIQLIGTINADGGKPEKLDELTTSIRNIKCNTIQRAALTATLQRVLKDHSISIGITDLRKATAPQNVVKLVIPQPVAEIILFRDIKVDPVPELGTVHIQNAGMLQQAIFGDRLARFGSEMHWWTGGQWQQVSKSDLAAAVAHSFVGSEYGKSSNVDGTEKQLKNMAPSHLELNPASRQIFFKNGIYNPSHPELGVRPHHPSNFNASTLTVNYTPDQPHPVWDKFMDDLFSEEPSRIVLLQELFGWMLISDNLGHQKAVALDGVGRSGKGTIIDTIGAIMGRGMADVSLAQLMDNKALSSLRTVNLAVDRDAKRPAVRDISSVHSYFNKITANEPITIPLLYSQDPWSGRLNCKLAIACNGIPVMADDSGAAPNRWIVLKFNRSFLGHEDLTLAARIRTELPAITGWAVDGLQRLMQNGGFTMPESSLEESHALVDISSPLKQFAEDRLVTGPDRRSHGDTLWESYRQWCRHNNVALSSKLQFIRSLERALQSEGVRYKRAVRIDGMIRTGLTGISLAECSEGLAGSNVTPISQALKDAPL